MRFEDERYVRLYTRDTLTCRRMGWQGRAVWHELLRKFDRAGILPINNEEPIPAVAAITEIPEEVVRVGLKRLLELGAVVTTSRSDENDSRILFAPRFVEAQECRQSDKARARASRERARARVVLETVTVPSQNVTDEQLPGQPEDENDDVTLRDEASLSVTGGSSPRVTESSQPVTQRDDPSHSVTKRHTRSHGVTPCRAVPCRTEDPKDQNPSSKQQALRVRARVREGSDSEQEQVDRPVGLTREHHPDQDFTDDTGLVATEVYVPSPWLHAEALASGLDRAEVHKTLERYRSRSKRAEATQSQHDKAFKGWLKNRQFDSGAKPPNGEHERKTPYYLLPPEERPPMDPSDIERIERKPPWHPDFKKAKSE